MLEDSLQNKLWVEKYRPKTVTEYIFHDESHQRSIMKMINEQEIPHLLFSGVQGSGKTSIAKILINEMKLDSSDVLIINSSDENSVDVMRDKIKSFVSTYALSRFKLVLLEESDYLSHNAQAVLRRLMEEFHVTCRFILTCNYDNKIIPALKSRCQHFHFKAPDQNDITEYVAKILFKEHVDFNLDVLDKYIATSYPDIRKIINVVQQNSIKGQLYDVSDVDDGDYKFKILTYLESDEWVKIRKIVSNNALNEEYDGLYRFLYDNLHTSKKFESETVWEQGIVIIADHLYKDASVADREINFASCLIKLGRL